MVQFGSTVQRYDEAAQKKLHWALLRSLSLTIGDKRPSLSERLGFKRLAELHRGSLVVGAQGKCNIDAERSLTVSVSFGARNWIGSSVTKLRSSTSFYAVNQLERMADPRRRARARCSSPLERPVGARPGISEVTRQSPAAGPSGSDRSSYVFSCRACRLGRMH